MMISFLSAYLTAIILILTTVCLAFVYMTRHFDYWKKRGIPYIKPTPFFGNFKEIATMKVHASVGLKNIYDKLDEPFFGFYIFDQPVLMLKSPKLINDILTKDSFNFIDRTTAYPSQVKIFSKFVFFEANPTWKISRQRLNPLFTPSMIKRTFHMVNYISKKMVKTITKETIVDTKTLMSKFLCEFIGNCYFGTPDDSLENDKSDFLSALLGLFSFNWRNAFSQMCYIFQPKLVNILKLQLIDSVRVNFFRKTLLNALKLKQHSKQEGNDFIDIFIEKNIKNGEMDRKLTKEEIDEILSHMISLTLGSETVGSTLSFILFELGHHVDIQERLRNEVIKIVEDDGDITYETLQKTDFLDKCILEAIRKYPIIPNICRKALNDYTFTDTDITIDKGTWIYIGTYALSNDEKIFTNPDEYNPDRFYDFKKVEGESYFLPFGGGPRVCLGERFGMMVMKLALMHILLNFTLEKCKDTPDKIEFEPKTILLRSKVNLKINIKPLLQ